MLRFKSIFVMIAVVVLVFMSACGGRDTAQQSEVVTITMWHHFTPDVEIAAMQDLADRFSELHPHVRFDVRPVGASEMPTVTATAMQSNDPPDLFTNWGAAGIAHYIDAGLIQDLTDELNKDGWKDDFLAGPLALYLRDDRYYGVTFRAGAWGFWYDKELFAQAGLRDYPATWDEFIVAVEALKAAGITPIALGAMDGWTTTGWFQYLAMRLASAEQVQSTATLNDRTGSFADRPFVRAAEMIRELVALRPFQTGYQASDYGEQLSLAANSNAAMTFDGWWGLTWISSTSEDSEATRGRLGFFPFPAVTGGAGDHRDVFGSGNGFAVGRDAPPEAIDFLRFMTSPENYTALVEAGFAAPPVMRGMESLVAEPTTLELMDLGDAAPNFYGEWQMDLGPIVSAVMMDQVVALFNDATSADLATKAIEEAVQSAILSN